MRGPYSYVPSTTIGGQAAIGIRGTVSSESGQGVRQILYVTATGAALPVKEVTNPGQAEGFVGHPRHRGVLGLGREEDGDGARAPGLAAQGGPADVGQLDRRARRADPWVHGPTRAVHGLIPVRSKS